MSTLTPNPLEAEVVSAAPASSLASRARRASACTSAAAPMASSMARRWRRGERPLVEDYLARHPELQQTPEAVLDLIYEEVCLRQEQGEEGAPSAVLARFPQWREQMQVLLACHRLLQDSALVAPRFPEVGESLGGFQLLAELGRGGQGRVFLATQSALADRPVVVKITPRRGQEHLSLARLQHSHIVPLYSAREEQGLRMLCMPYLGGVTLSRVLEALRPVPLEQRRGQHFLDVLDQATASSSVALPTQGPARAFLAGASHVQAVCWVGAHLADALRYAHERGLVHLDVKPSNVLLAADGLPMLLDFHLAREPVEAGGEPPEWLGGTPAYMSPEQRAGVEAVQRGGAVPAIDARSDLYSLALVLFEALGGTLPLPPGQSPARLLRRLPGVSGGLANILARCLERDPARRYASARALAADLTRHLKDLPLAEVRTPLPERWAKWRRRSPHSLGRWAALLFLGATALGVFGGFFFYQHKRQEWQAEIAARDKKLRVQERNALVARLHDLADTVRALSVETVPAAVVDGLEEQSAAVWTRRDEALAFLESPDSEEEGSAPSPEQTKAKVLRKEQIRADLLDLVLLWPDLRVRQAPEGVRQERLREALDILDQAEKALGHSAALYRQRGKWAKELGLEDVARQSQAQAEALAPRTAWEHYALGRFHLQSGDLKRASASLREAVDLQPGSVWPYFYLGVCAYRLGDYEEAVLAFTSASAVPGRSAARCLYNRALAYERWGRPDRALLDYDKVLRLDGAFAPAALNRAVLHYKARRYPEALADLDWAARHGASHATVEYNRALVHYARGDRGATLAALERALVHDPGHEQARSFLLRLRSR